MSFSLSYNGTDLSTYGLVLVLNDAAYGTQLMAETLQLADKAHAAISIFPSKPISLEVIITGTDSPEFQSNFLNIKRIIGQREAKQLILGTLPDRYWMARFERLVGEMVTAHAWRGELAFSADDPLAYAVEESDSDFNIDSDPKTIVEATGGSAYVKPVFTLTAGENLAAITLKIENLDTDEELQWQGSLNIGQVLTIDSEACIVKKQGVADMATVSGQFPRLKPGQDNNIKITGFSNTGTLNITYREAFL